VGARGLRRARAQKGDCENSTSDSECSRLFMICTSGATRGTGEIQGRGEGAGTCGKGEAEAVAEAGVGAGGMRGNAGGQARPQACMRQASVETPSARLPTVSFRSLQRATRTVEDFCRCPPAPGERGGARGCVATLAFSPALRTCRGQIMASRLLGFGVLDDDFCVCNSSNDV
jgi:hypothetical protein